MKYIPLAFHNGEMVVVNDMGIFTAHFCFSKKQRFGVVDAAALEGINAVEPEESLMPIILDDVEIPDEDDI